VARPLSPSPSASSLAASRAGWRCAASAAGEGGEEPPAQAEAKAGEQEENRQEEEGQQKQQREEEEPAQDKGAEAKQEVEAAPVAPRDIIHQEELLDASSRHELLRMPSAWQNAGEWVDLEFERAGLDEHRGQGALASPWDSESFPHPEMNVFWPNRTLSEHRSRPFTLPRGAREAAKRGDAAQKAAEEQLQANRQRLCALWRMSRSHGISWDELDRAYVTFAQAGRRRQDEWKRRDPNTNAAPRAQTEKIEAWRRAKGFVQRFCPEGRRAEEVFPSRTKRLAARVFMRAKRRWFNPWRPGRLSGHLQQLVAVRMAQRETEERVLGLRPEKP